MKCMHDKVGICVGEDEYCGTCFNAGVQAQLRMNSDIEKMMKEEFDKIITDTPRTSPVRSERVKVVKGAVKKKVMKKKVKK